MYRTFLLGNQLKDMIEIIMIDLLEVSCGLWRWMCSGPLEV